MSEKKDDRKKYWLKLDKDFLKSPQMKVIKNMPNGKDYIIFYLSLMLESVETVGHLRFTSLVPYNDEMLSAVTDTNVDIVRSAIKVFCELGMMQIFDDGTIFMTEVPKITGKECESAERVRKYRIRQEQEKTKLLQCNEDVTKCNEYIDKDKDKDKDKEEEVNKEYIIYNYITTNFGILINGTNFQKIQEWLEIYDDEILCLAVDRCVACGKRTLNYMFGILNNWKGNGYKTIKDIEENDIKKEKDPYEGVLRC